MGIEELLGPKRDKVRAAASRHGVLALFVFGSFARGEAGPESDIDILVDFAGPVGLMGFIGLKMELEAILGRPVDLVTREALRPRMLETVLRESVRAA